MKAAHFFKQALIFWQYFREMIENQKEFEAKTTSRNCSIQSGYSLAIYMRHQKNSPQEIYLVFPIYNDLKELQKPNVVFVPHSQCLHYFTCK